MLPLQVARTPAAATLQICGARTWDSVIDYATPRSDLTARFAGLQWVWNRAWFKTALFQVHGRIDRLERAEMIDPHSVQQDGDEMSGMGEIGENAPNEANFAESTSIVEAQDSIQVTANSRARLRLDKGVA